MHIHNVSSRPGQVQLHAQRPYRCLLPKPAHIVSGSRWPNSRAQAPGKVKVKAKALVTHHVRLFTTTWTVACQAPLSMGFFRQGYWSGLPRSSPGDLPNPEIEPVSLVSPALAGRLFTTMTHTVWGAEEGEISHVTGPWTFPKLLPLICLSLHCVWLPTPNRFLFPYFSNQNTNEEYKLKKQQTNHRPLC